MIKQQIAIVADIRTEGKTYCSIRCMYCRKSLVQMPDGYGYKSHWIYNWCMLFKEKLYGHNHNYYPKRRPKCMQAMVQKTANDLSSEYRMLFSVGDKDGGHKYEFDSFEGELIRKLMETCRRSMLYLKPKEFEEDDVVLIRLAKQSDWPTKYPWERVKP